MRWIILATVGAAAIAAALLVQRTGEPDHRSPYVADSSSPVRGLSAREVDDLLSGQGAGFARTAELNGYPGPRHVLDLGNRLELNDSQRRRVEAIFAAMQELAKRLGADIVERERRLSAAFADRQVTALALEASVDTLAGIYGTLRATHLAAHLETTAVLSHDQISRYNELRGYGRDHAH